MSPNLAAGNLTGTGTANNHPQDNGYEGLRRNINLLFTKLIAGGVPLFTTDATGLWEAYLNGFPPTERQYHNCNSCRQFFERFGGLVVIDDIGQTTPAIWPTEDVPQSYADSIAAVERIVRKAKITGVFLSKLQLWGNPITGPWTHFFIEHPPVFTHPVLTPSQAMAEKLEDYRNMSRALAEFPQPAVETAVGLLKTEALYRSEKVLGVAEWLLNLHQTRQVAKSWKANILWRAVATAPPGFCHPRSSMIGTLLDDIVAGKPFEEASESFAAKMHPLQYQRPQAPPTAGNIAQAEKIFEQTGLAPALKRRIARISEDNIPLLWKPTEREELLIGNGLFGHLKPNLREAPKEMTDVTVPPMTWSKFVQSVLPTAELIELQISHSTRRFIVIVGPEDLNAPPLLQWDLEPRNPFSWYCWHGGADPSQYGLKSGWVHVNGITRLPARWNDSNDKFKHHGDGVILLLDGARESRNDAGLALFPEQIRSELHSVRSTIEAYSKRGQLSGLAEGTAIGYDLRATPEQRTDIRLRVKSGPLVAQYRIDRWD